MSTNCKKTNTHCTNLKTQIKYTIHMHLMIKLDKLYDRLTYSEIITKNTHTCTHSHIDTHTHKDINTKTQTHTHAEKTDNHSY